MKGSNVGFVIFRVSDLEASTRYFSEVLGLEYIPEEDEPNFRAFHSGNFHFGLVQAEGNNAGKVDFYIIPSSLEAARSELKDKGVAVGPVEQRPFGTIFSVPTPDGFSTLMWQPRA